MIYIHINQKKNNFITISPLHPPHGFHFHYYLVKQPLQPVKVLATPSFWLVNLNYHQYVFGQ